MEIVSIATFVFASSALYFSYLLWTARMETDREMNDLLLNTIKKQEEEVKNALKLQKQKTDDALELQTQIMENMRISFKEDFASYFQLYQKDISPSIFY